MKKKDVDFDTFVEAVQDAGLARDSEDPAVVEESEAIPLTHTSGVTPKDWERVQQSLDEKE